jgi:hypothetical protein
VSFQDMKTPRRRKVVQSVASVLSELLEPAPLTTVNVGEDEFFRLMRENGITCGSGIVLERALVVAKP